MELYGKRRNSPYQISIYTSEIKFIAGCAAGSGALETGGEFIGRNSPVGGMIIELATQAGPNSKYGVAHFCQDLDYFFYIYDEATRRFKGRELLGEYHRHTISLNYPSYGDEKHIRAIASANNFSRMIEIILTREDGDGNRVTNVTSFRETPYNLCMGWCLRQQQRWSTWWQKTKQKELQTSKNMSKIVVNPFLFFDAPAGMYTRCELRILPGESPVRRALIEDGILKEQQLLFDYPSGHIIIRDKKQPITGEDPFGNLPAKFLDQYLELPVELRDEIEIKTAEGKIALIIPLPDSEKIYLFIDEKTCVIQQVYLHGKGKCKCTDISDSVLTYGRFTKILTIYKNLRKLISQKKRSTTLASYMNKSSKRPHRIKSRKSKKKHQQKKGGKQC